MTRAQYTIMVRDAVDKFVELRDRLPEETEIVFVVSVNVLEAMRNYEREMLLENFDMANFETSATYMGARVCYINETEHGDFFVPVPRSEHYEHINGVEVDDLVLFDEENLYKLLRVTPEITYVDTGMTVSFVNNAMHAATVTNNHIIHDDIADDARIIRGDIATGTRITNDWNLAYDTTSDLAYGITATNAATWEGVTINGTPLGTNTWTIDFDNGNTATAVTATTTTDRNRRDVYNIFEGVTYNDYLHTYTFRNDVDGARSGFVNLHAVDEPQPDVEDIDAGDTTLLDEYLNEFKRDSGLKEE